MNSFWELGWVISCGSSQWASWSLRGCAVCRLKLSLWSANAKSCRYCVTRAEARCCMTLEMEAPPVEVALSQRTLDDTLGVLKIRRAIVVPTCKLAYLARLAFGEGDYRVFYDDISAAINWLGKESSP